MRSALVIVGDEGFQMVAQTPFGENDHGLRLDDDEGGSPLQARRDRAIPRGADPLLSASVASPTDSGRPTADGPTTRTDSWVQLRPDRSVTRIVSPIVRRSPGWPTYNPVLPGAAVNSS